MNRLLIAGCCLVLPFGLSLLNPARCLAQAYTVAT